MYNKFLQGIFILFFAISILEDSGYMARSAFIMDGLMHKLGLHGKSFIPMLMGFGCNVPAIMATRTLESRSDRILTILITPLMSCSARLPIYAIFAAAFFPRHQGTVVFSMYLLGIVLAIGLGLVFKRAFFPGESIVLAAACLIFCTSSFSSLHLKFTTDSGK
jgi:ferrous iron transport protein B